MSKLKVAICQFSLRETNSYDEMASHLKEQCRLAAETGPDMIMFPEFTTFGLLSMAGADAGYADLPEIMPRIVGKFTPVYEQVFREEADRSGALIIGGSTWTQDEPGELGSNTAYLFFPGGRVAIQKKNHLFPGETDWGTVPHDILEIFEHAGATFGVMTCYDSEFPEVGRHFMNSGAQLLLAPSATYTVRGYYRVRRCCAARAVENQLFVIEGHQVGAIGVPKDKPFTGFGRSAILSPIDDQIGSDDGLVIEAADGKTETIVTGEIDLDALARSRETSEATILKDRRPETYKRSYRVF
jgi:predicted amidohydrolase